jgi:hypothetical protein
MKGISIFGPIMKCNFNTDLWASQINVMARACSHRVELEDEKVVARLVFACSLFVCLERRGCS